MQEAIISDDIETLETLFAETNRGRISFEDQLRQLDERLDGLFAAIPAGLAIVDNNLRYLHINETLARIHGVPVKEHLGKTIREIVPGVESEIEAMLRQVIVTGEPALNLKLTGSPPSDPGVVHRWLSSFVPLFGRDGKPRGLGALVIDVTDLKQIEDSLSECRARCQMLMDHIQDGVLVFDSRGFIVDVNERACELFGYRRKELLNLGIRDLLAAEDFITTPVSGNRLPDGDFEFTERRLVRKDGKVLRAQVIGSKISNDRIQVIARKVVSHESEDGPGPESSDGSPSSSTSRAKAIFLKQMAIAMSMAADAFEREQMPVDLMGFSSKKEISFYDEVSRFEVELIERALKQARGRKKIAAQLLNINQSTLHAMIKRYKIEVKISGDDGR